MSRIFLFFIFCLFFCCCSFDNNSSTEICFIGDSITYQWDLESSFPANIPIKHAQNGATLQDAKEWDLSDCQGKTTISLLGTNDSRVFFSDSGRQAFVEEYMLFLKNIHAEKNIVISILPRNFEGKQDPIINELIADVNRLIRNQLDSVEFAHTFLNLYPKFIKKGLEIRVDLFKDGLHPNINGQEIMTSEVQKNL